MSIENRETSRSSEKTMPGFSSLGFRVPIDGNALGRLLESAVLVSQTYPSPSGDTYLCADDSYRLWQNYTAENSPPVLECGAAPGMQAFTTEPPTGHTIQAWLVDTAGTPDAPTLPVCFSSPHHALGSQPQGYDLQPLSLTMLADACLLFESPEALAAHPNTQGWPTPSFAATGMFDHDGNVLDHPKTSAVLTGHVTLARKVTNSLTGMPFWTLQVRTQYGELSVCLPYDALALDPTGKIIAALGTMSGSFPALIPEPDATPESPEDGPGIDNAAAEARIRQLTLAFMESTEFDSMFTEIHPHKFTQHFATGIGLFNKEIRAVAKTLGERRQLSSPELRQRYLEVARTAPIVFAHVVMANVMMLEDGKGSPALVVLAWGDNAMETMSRAREVLSKVHFGRPENDDEARLADEIADEDYHFGRRRRMPDWLTGGEECYAADLWVSGAALDDERLRMEVVVCFAEPGPTGLTMAIPGKFIKQALDELDPSKPKPPPLPTFAPPPPLPPR
jgi:hypothetical protein